MIIYAFTKSDQIEKGAFYFKVYLNNFHTHQKNMDLTNDISDQGSDTETEDSIDYRNEILKNLNIIRIFWKIDSNYPKIREALNSIVIEIIEDDNFTSFMSLLNNGYKLDVLNEKRQSALHYAFSRNSESIIEAYLSRKPFSNDEPDWADSNGLTHLHIVCDQFNMNVLDIVRIYLNNGSDINARYHSDPTNEDTGSTPLHFAMRNENTFIIELLLENGADINAADGKGVTPFHLACQSTDEYIQEKIEFFLNSYHADVDAKNEHGDTPLLSVFENYSDDGTLLFFNIKLAKQNFDVLMRNGANILAKNVNGDTVLHLIIKTLKSPHCQLYWHYDLFDDTECAELVERVLESSSELLEMKNNEHITPLQLAVSMTSTDIVKILLNHKAKTSSLKIACESGSIFCYPLIVPGFDIVQNIMHIIDSLSNQEFEFSLEDHLMIIRFLVHEADVCNCSLVDVLHNKENLRRLILFGTGVHAKQVLSEMRKSGLPLGSGDDLLYHLFLLKEANFYMDRELVEILISSPRNESFVLSEGAKKELAILKSEIKLKNGVMLHDLMLQHPFEASRFLKDDNFDCKLIIGKFEVFKDIILGFVTKAIVRNYIVKRAYEFFPFTPLSFLPAVCFQVVLHHLSNVDIFNLCASASLPGSNNV